MYHDDKPNTTCIEKEISMYQLFKLFFTALLCCGFLFSQQAVAKDCYEQSPFLAESEDDYYNLEDTVALSAKEKATLATLLKGIQGKWKGTGQYTECRGPDRAPRTLSKTAAIEAKILSASKTKVNVHAKIHIKEKRIKRTEKLDIPNLTNVYALSFTKNGALIFSERYRRSNARNVKPKKPKASSNTVSIIDKIINIDATPAPKKQTKKLSSRLVEVIYEVRRDGPTLSIIRSHYTNGVYVAEEKWALRKN